MESEKFDEQLTEEFNWKMKLIDSDGEEVEIGPDDVHSDDEFSFSFTGAGPDGSPVSADDVFQNGQIKPIFPLFDRSLIGFDSNGSEPRLRSPVKVFAETNDSDREGPYCEWSGKAVEASASASASSQPETCKKSNSTGFSKIWRFRDLMHRSSSDGKDAFVFLNSSSSSAAVKSGGGGGGGGGEVQSKVAGEKIAKVKKVGKAKTASSVHEMHYVRNRAVKEGDRRRSYLPYRPELVGFFTNVHGGVRRNMHPF